jgi:hypothetical protein
MAATRLDLANQVKAWLEGFSARRPLGGADFARMSRYILSRLNLAQQLLGVTTNAVIVDFAKFDNALGIDQKAAP